MAKSSKSGRSSATRTVYTGGRPQQMAAPIYGKTPSARVGGNSSQFIQQKISGCDPKAHTIGKK